MKIAMTFLALLLTTPFQDDPKECCEQMEKGWFCTRCNKVLEDFETMEFDIGGDKGKLKACKICADKTSQDLRGLYASMAESIDQCVRAYYACAQCRKFRHAAEDCCGNPMVRRTDKARMWFRCEGCGRGSFTAGECPRTDDNAQWRCPKAGDRYKAQCLSAGVFPHGTEPPKQMQNWGGGRARGR